MLEQMKWEDVYELWQQGAYFFPKLLTTPVFVETVFVEQQQDSYIYGYDWLEASDAQKRKQLIENDSIEFLYFTKTSNKGTIQTAEMLVEAQNEEERAAIWIAATAKELSEYMIGNGVGYYANILHMAACDFLRTRYTLWHHAMKKLVPDIAISSSVLNHIVCKDAEPIMGLIQMNTVFLKSTWRILRYSFLKDGEMMKSRFHI